MKGEDGHRCSGCCISPAFIDAVDCTSDRRTTRSNPPPCQLS